ncbi:hypothetical protein BURK1_03224 [Burkholderiales bacterium]|nr:hypothetical protein BURK1_03224 [Burkholderiales bacterium]
MIDRLAADAVVALHVAYIAFACLGGLLALRHPGWALAHLPAAAWGAYAELSATVCPLTPLENHFRRRAGEAGYGGGFVEHYVMPLLYPAGLTQDIQAWLGVFLLALNAAIYALVIARRRRR